MNWYILHKKKNQLNELLKTIEAASRKKPVD